MVVETVAALEARAEVEMGEADSREEEDIMEVETKAEELKVEVMKEDDLAVNERAVKRQCYGMCSTPFCSLLDYHNGPCCQTGQCEGRLCHCPIPSRGQKQGASHKVVTATGGSGTLSVQLLSPPLTDVATLSGLHESSCSSNGRSHRPYALQSDSLTEGKGEAEAVAATEKEAKEGVEVAERRAHVQTEEECEQQLTRRLLAFRQCAFPFTYPLFLTSLLQAHI